MILGYDLRDPWCYFQVYLADKKAGGIFHIFAALVTVTGWSDTFGGVKTKVIVLNWYLHSTFKKVAHSSVE